MRLMKPKLRNRKKRRGRERSVEEKGGKMKKNRRSSDQNVLGGVSLRKILVGGALCLAPERAFGKL